MSAVAVTLISAAMLSTSSMLAAKSISVAVSSVAATIKSFAVGSSLIFITPRSKLCDALAPAVSVTVTVTVSTPTSSFVGVPVITPVAVSIVAQLEPVNE